MNPIRHPSNTRTLSAPEGWDQTGLPVEPLGITDQVLEGVPCVWSFWKPDRDELEALNAGENVVLSIVGRTMPPALLLVTASEKQSARMNRGTGEWEGGPADEDGSEPRDADPAGLTAAARDVMAERRRQVEKEGYSPAHDDEHSFGDLARAAAAYAVQSPLARELECPPPSWWPWDREDWKPTSRRCMLVKAGALILAELERIDRRAGDAREIVES